MSSPHSVSIICGCASSMVFEYFFDLQPEQPRNLEGQRQAWIVLLGLNGIDRLPGNLQLLSHLALRKTAHLPQLAQSALHRYLHPPRPTPTPHHSPPPLLTHTPPSLAP